MHVRIVAVGIGMAVVAQAFAAPYQELNPKFNRIKSRTMIRKVTKATLANLDLAAYTANPVRFDPKAPKIGSVAPVALKDLTFGDALTDLVDQIGQTPLTAAEKDRPYSWRPVVDRLWKVVKDPSLTEITNRVAGKRWSDAMVAQPYQEITSMYLHDTDKGVQFWVKIEFQPWVKFLQGVDDEDQDGFPEMYGRLTLSTVADSTRTRSIEWIKGDYASKVLTKQEITDWITTLAGYWYPTMNTDIIDMGSETTWPTKDAVKDAIKELKGFTVQNPAAVVRGNPFGKPIYNIYLADAAPEGAAEAAPAPAAPVVAIDKKPDLSVSAAFKANNDRFAAELKPYGSYDAWAKKLAPFITAEKQFIAKLPEGQMGFKGKEDWIFFRKSLEMMTAGDLLPQAKDKNPIPHLVEMKKYLDEQKTNLLFIPIPNKEDIYFEKLPFDMPKDATAMVNPYFRKFLKDCQDAGIEVVDVLPALLAAKAGDKTSKENLYQHQDTHWTNRGLQIVAAMIADRVKQYSWYADASKSAVTYTIVDTTFLRQGDIVERLPEAERTAYPAVELAAQRVYLPGGKPFPVSDKTSPILLIGDSFTGVFEAVDCKSSGVGAHIAAKTGLPTEIITSWGGGPLVREKMIRARKNDMGAKRLVVYMMVARDLYNYAQNWAPLKTE